MILILIGPHSSLYATRTTVVNPLLVKRIILSEPLKEVETEPLEVKHVQDQISDLLTSSDLIAKNITFLLGKSLGANVCFSKELAFTSSENRNRGWLSVDLRSESISKPNLQYSGYGLEDLSLHERRKSKKDIEVKFENSSWLNDLQRDELKKYSFGLYRYSKSGDDRMQIRKHFKMEQYSASISLSVDDICSTPSDSFKETVRRNYINESFAKDNSLYLLVFREDKISKEHEDLLLIY